MVQVFALAFLLSSDVDTPAEEFLRRYRARETSVQTCVVKSTWLDFVDGQPARRDRQTLYFDSLGRRRLQMESEQPSAEGGWEPHEEVPRHWDKIFDGELTASIVFEPHKDRRGRDIRPGEKGGYRGAQIFDGAWEITTQRAPITFADGIVDRLESALQNNQHIEIESETIASATMLFPDQTSGYLWRLEIDKERDLVPVVIARVDTDGKVIMATVFEHALASSGVWYPRAATHRYYGDRSEGDVPLRETRFEVTNIEINDPAFRESVFTIALAPDTAVWDSRYDASYRVGEEQVHTARLAALAAAALENRDAQQRGRPAPVRARIGRGGWVLIAVHCAAALLIVAAVVYRRLARR